MGQTKDFIDGIVFGTDPILVPTWINTQVKLVALNNAAQCIITTCDKRALSVRRCTASSLPGIKFSLAMWIKRELLFFLFWN